MPADDVLTAAGIAHVTGSELPSSSRRFNDGAEYRIELPNIEGPRALAAAIEEAKKRGVHVHRATGGTGIMLFTDSEIREMCALARAAQIELGLFVGPRASWDIGAGVGTPAGRVIGAQLRGRDQLKFAAEDVLRGVELGLRGVLVADPGLLSVLSTLKATGQLPHDLVVKVSVQLAAANPASVKAMETLGADTFNLPTDLTLAHIAEIRSATTLPLDIYVESPDEFGGFVRYYDLPEIIRVSAPVFIKSGLRNAPNIIPWGTHIDSVAVSLAVERVRRAEITRDMIDRYCPQALSTRAGTAFYGIPT